MAASVVLLVWMNVGSLIYNQTASKPLPVFNHLCQSSNTSDFIFNNSLDETDKLLLYSMTSDMPVSQEPAG